MPFMPSLAAKNSVPFTFVRLLVSETELNITVPAAVPSLLHSDPPQLKNSVPFTFVRLLRLLKYVTKVVPAAVPSLFHSPLFVPSSAEKNSVPLTFVRNAGDDPALPGLMSLTSTLPAAVPSLFHSSRPLAPSSAVK